jgi:hypothetical protein
VVPEALLEHSNVGLYPTGDGWFVVNARDLRWFESELGLYTMFDSEEARFDSVAYARFAEDRPIVCPEEFPG